MATLSSDRWYREEELLPISGLRHMAVCLRQFALVHIEQSWVENFYTAEGRILHKNADRPHYETRHGRKLVYALPMLSYRLGLTGKADVVEFPAEGLSEPVAPVEFKRGHPKADDVDEVQVCAQAMCLEEMMGVHIPRGFLYYHQERHRVEVEFSSDLRDRVEALSAAMHKLYQSGETPVVARMPKCRVCSLDGICQPQWSGTQDNVWEKWKSLAERSGE